MLKPQLLFARAAYLVFRGRRERALQAIDDALAAEPSARLAVSLHVLEARTAGRLDKLMRMHGAIERGLVAAQRGANEQRDVERLGVLFDDLAGTTVAPKQGIRMGKVRILVAPAPGKQLKIYGLCAQLDSELTQGSVRLYLEGKLVSELYFLPFHDEKCAKGRGQFQFRVKRSLLSELGSESTFELEIAGERQPLPTRIFGSHWPRGTDGSAAVSEGVLSKLAQGYILDSAGELSLPKNEDTAWLNSTFELYNRARSWLKETLGHDLYLTGGTLLGYARSGEIISFDKDFDTGYVSKHTEPDEIRREYKEIIIGMLRQGENVRLLTSAEPPKIRRDYFWFGSGGHHIDVFVGAFINGKYRRPTFVDTQLTPDDFYPFEVKKLSGYEVVVPRNAEKKVAAIYGPGWKTPDPFWIKVKSPEMLAYRKTIMLTDQDLLEIADASPEEGPVIRQLLAGTELVTAF